MIDLAQDPLRVTESSGGPLVERVFLATLTDAPERTGDMIALGASEAWFTDPLCRRVWSGIEKLHGKGIPCDLALVEGVIGRWDTASGEEQDMAQVVKLGELGHNPAYLRHFAGLLKRFAAERTTRDITAGIVRDQSTPVTADEYAAQITHGASQLVSLADSVIAETATDPRAVIERAAAEALGALELKPGVHTGMSNLDYYLRGMRAGEMIVLGARPAVGKSSFAVSVCVNLLRRDPDSVIFFASVEMPVAEIAKRFLSNLAGVSVEAIENRTASPAEVSAWKEAAADLERYQPVIVNRGMSDAQRILSAAQNLKARRQRLDLIVVDHLHRMVAKGANRTAELTAISGAVARMASELEVPVLALAQLNRGIETREDKTPTLADLRDSGSIEQDADMVLFLHRPGATGSTNQDPTKAQVYISKNRRGQTGMANLRFIPHLTRFAAEEPADRAEKFTL